MRHQDIVDGGVYALVRRQSDRESLTSARKVEVIDREKNYLPNSSWRQDGRYSTRPENLEPMPGDGWDHILVKDLGYFVPGNPDRNEPPSEENPRFAAHPRTLFVEWSEWERLVEAKKARDAARQKAEEQANEEHHERWTQLAARFTDAGLAGEQLLQTILVKAREKRNPYTHSRRNSVEVTYEDLAEIVNLYEERN